MLLFKNDTTNSSKKKVPLEVKMVLGCFYQKNKFLKKYEGPTFKRLHKV